MKFILHARPSKPVAEAAIRALPCHQLLVRTTHRVRRIFEKPALAPV